MASSHSAPSGSAKSPRSPSDRTSRRPAPVAGPSSTTRRMEKATPTKDDHDISGVASGFAQDFGQADIHSGNGGAGAGSRGGDVGSHNATSRHNNTDMSNHLHIHMPPPIQTHDEMYDERNRQLGLERSDVRRNANDHLPQVVGNIQARTVSNINPLQVQSPPIGRDLSLLQDPRQYPSGSNVTNHDPGHANNNPGGNDYCTAGGNIFVNNYFQSPRDSIPVPLNPPPTQVSRSISESSAPKPRNLSTTSKVLSPSTSKDAKNKSSAKNKTVEYYTLDDLPANAMPKNIDRVSSESPSHQRPEADWRSNVNMSPPIRSSSSAGPNTKTKQEGGVLSTPKAPDRSLSKPSEVPSAYINQNKGRSVDQPTPPPSLVRDKGKGRQKDANPIPSRGQTNTVDVKSFKMRERTPDPLCIPEPSPYTQGIQLSFAPSSTKVPYAGPTPLTTDTDTIPPRKPLGYPSLKEFTGVNGGQWILHRGIEDHIPAFMSLRFIDRSPSVIPLWYPQPFLTNVNGQKRGIEVGDIVYVNDSGHIHVLFNILRSFDDNRFEGADPPPRSYYRHLDIDSVREKPAHHEIQSRKCFFTDGILSSTIEKTKHDGVERYRFEAGKGATNEGIIILPHGAIRSFIPVSFFGENPVKEFFSRYSPSWYDHVKAMRPKIENGTLLLISETYCTKTSGVATFISKKPIRKPLFIDFYHDKGASKYFWENANNCWISNIGTSYPEMNGSVSQLPSSQCFGVKLYSLSLDDKTWAEHFGPPRSSPADRASPSHAANFPSDSSVGNSSTSPVRLGSILSKLSPRSWMEKKSDQLKNTGSVQQLSLPETGESRYYDYQLLWVNPPTT